MSEELGKINKPEAEEFRKGKKLYFVPLIYCGDESPADYRQMFNRYWNEVEDQISSLERKLGAVRHIYHEMVSEAGDEGVKLVEQVHDKSYRIIENRLSKGAEMEAAEEPDLLSEFMDWSRCLMMGLQNQNVFGQVYKSYNEAAKKRNEYIAACIAKTLREDEVGILFMREGHQIQFRPDIRVFYVSPPALDEINRWLRRRDAAPPEEGKPEEEPPKNEPQA